MNNVQTRLIAGDPDFFKSYLEAKLRDTAKPEGLKAARDLYMESYGGRDLASPGSEQSVDQILQVNGDTAIISISGPLSKEGPDYWDIVYGCGGTSYQTIIAACQKVMNSYGISNVVFAMDTPGGNVDGVDLARQAIADLSKVKSTTAQVTGMLASAGYWLACPVNKILAGDPTDLIGSIGVRCAGWDLTEFYKTMGVVKVNMVSSNAPKKAAGFETPEGRDVIQEQLDATERVFLSRVAEGRKVSVDAVKANFGQGGLLLASDPDTTKPSALKAGMIDGVGLKIKAFPVTVKESDDDNDEEDDEDDESKASIPAFAGVNIQEEIMSLDEILAKEPAAKAEYDKRVQAAREEERGKFKALAPIVESESYAANAAIRKQVALALKGESSVDVVRGAVAAVDAVVEERKSQQAKGETAGLGETGATAPVAGEDAEIQKRQAGLADALRRRAR